MKNTFYYIADVELSREKGAKHDGALRRFETKEAAREWVAKRIAEPDATGDAEILLFHPISGKTEIAFRCFRSGHTDEHPKYSELP